ncbi:cGMP-dependent 3',5'-cyclic phosphodiesterase-like [Bacillus rossius redtenbacheri]|uniref:cGMP-dependent 3',5'-cyclic phosphodiesterase-like n=1 Tax=Bacillus rossius redtenbacheri TaxID=93214 RepID=UPI002FDCC7B5
MRYVLIDSASLAVTYQLSLPCLSRTSAPEMTEPSGKARDDCSIYLQLCSRLHDSSSAKLQTKVNSFLVENTHAAAVFLVFLLPENEEAVVQVVGGHVLEQDIRFPANVSMFSPDGQISHHCAVQDLAPDLAAGVRTIAGTDVATFVSVPVCRPGTEQVAMFACLVGCPEGWVLSASRIVYECFSYCSGTLLNTFAYEEEMRLKVQCQSLLAVARNLFAHLGDVSNLLREIMMEARKLTNAERCSLFLFDSSHQELVAKVFDGDSSKREVRIAKDQGIAGHVAMSGKLLNIEDAYKHPLFFKGMDEVTGFRTRSILCFPIRDENGIIGIAQLCNKKNGHRFNKFDEEAAMAFSIYCGISIMHSLVYQKIRDAQARSKISNELLMYHMNVCEDDLKRLLHCEELDEPRDYTSFSFSPRSISSEVTPKFIFKMFDDLGLIRTFHINRETLARFILFVKKGYRDVPYHNWMHAFSVAHFAYISIKNLELIEDGYLSQLDVLAFLVSCLCHDLDHRGTTSSFQMKSGTALACLYSSEGSVMERHHLSQAMCILNTEGCNILEGLTEDEYSRCLDLVRDIILATDLASHFRLFSEQQALASGGLPRGDPRHKNLLLSLLMTASDLSDQTKDWRTSKHIAELVYKEFFAQGDLEKTMGVLPLHMMDREKACIPELQIQFLSDVVVPLFDLLRRVFPEAACLLRAAETNRECWLRAKEYFARRLREGRSSSSILGEADLESLVLSLSPASCD